MYGSGVGRAGAGRGKGGKTMSWTLLWQSSHGEEQDRHTDSLFFFSAFHSVFPPFRSSFFPSCSVLKLHDTSFYIYLFTPGCPGSSLLHTGYLVGANGSYCLAVVHRLLIVVLSVVGGASALEGGFGLCGTWAQLPHGMWNLPGPGI